VREEIVFDWLSSNSTKLVFILYSLGGNMCSAVANHMNGSVEMFDLQHYDEIFFTNYPVSLLKVFSILPEILIWQVFNLLQLFILLRS
jgi:hypothetical protein